MRQVRRHPTILRTIRHQRAVRNLQMDLRCSHHRHGEANPLQQTWTMRNGVDNKHQIDTDRCRHRDQPRMARILQVSLRRCSQGQDSRQILVATDNPPCNIYTRRLHSRGPDRISRLLWISGIMSSIGKWMSAFHQDRTANLLDLRCRRTKLDRASMHRQPIRDPHFITSHSLKDAMICDK